MGQVEKSYLQLLRDVLRYGERRTAERTGVGTFMLHSQRLEHDMRNGFPLLTTKHVNFRAVEAELYGFLSAFTSAEEFRLAGTRIWDANANETKSWLGNPNRVGTDDLGRIYGVQWRRWQSYREICPHAINASGLVSHAMSQGYELVGRNTATGAYILRAEIDQLRNLVDGLVNDPEGRRHIVTAWNPGELDSMALPPCHMMFQCFVSGGDTGERVLSLQMYQRSADLFLGVPFNLASYALLLQFLCDVTGYTPGTLTLVFGDVHVYASHEEQVRIQLGREQHPLPVLARSMECGVAAGDIDSFHVGAYELIAYNNSGGLRAPMAV